MCELEPLDGAAELVRGDPGVALGGVEVLVAAQLLDLTQARAWTFFETAPVRTGGVMSKSTPGTVSVPVHVSLAVPHRQSPAPITTELL
jgi:hypothetical protein